MRSEQKFTVKKLFADDRGFILIAALTLLTVLTLLGTTAYILSSTDIKIGGNFRNTQSALQVAMAGAERSRAVLNSHLFPSSGTVVSLSAELAARKGANNVLNGYASGTDDIALASGILNGSNYVAYLTNDTLDSNGQYSTTDSNSRALITSVATGISPNNASARVEMVVYSPAGLANSPATIYSRGDVTGNGSSLIVSNTDSCGETSALPNAIYVRDPAITDLNGSPTITGGVAVPPRTANIDIEGYINALRGGATTTLTEDSHGGHVSYGDSTNYVTVYSNTSSPVNVQGLSLRNVTGYGILMVQGDLDLGGGFQWNGIILVTGSLTLNGGGGGLNIRGLVYSGTSTATDVTINGGNNIGYDSCNVRNALNEVGARVVNWRQVY